MAYNVRQVVRAVKDSLARRPTARLASIADASEIDRHTITRSIKRLEGRPFSDIQQDAVFLALAALAGSSKPLSIRDISKTLGCSPRAARKWIEKFESRSAN